MPDINKDQIKFLASQRLDDTPQGGGQMTSIEIVDGVVNNLYHDQSDLDFVLGRASIRKVYLAVTTELNEVLLGANIVLTRDAKDPNVSVVFMSTENHFDTRSDASSRIEGYLVKGPQRQLFLLAKHFKGTDQITVYTGDGWPVPEVNEVLILEDQTNGNEQYVRIQEVTEERRNYLQGDRNFFVQIVTLKLSERLDFDFDGEEVIYGMPNAATLDTKIFSSVFADTSQYFGVADLIEPIDSGALLLRVGDVDSGAGDITQALVPSSRTPTIITDDSIVNTTTFILQKDGLRTTSSWDEFVSVTRVLPFSISPGGVMHIGEAVIPGSLNFSGGGFSLTDDSERNVFNGSTLVGSIQYETGLITFGEPGTTTSGTGTLTYKPACQVRIPTETGSIRVTSEGTSFVYAIPGPLVQPESLKIEYIHQGKWYTMWDTGSGRIAGSDESIGAGTVNYSTNSVGFNCGAQPDIGYDILLSWAKPAEFFDLAGETLPLKYRASTQHAAVVKNTFELSWADIGATGPGPDGTYGIVDDGDGKLYKASWQADPPLWIPTAEEVGWIRYATGEHEFGIGSGQAIPIASNLFNYKYNYGLPVTETVTAPPRNNEKVEFFLENGPVIPGTFRIEFSTLLESYDDETRTRDVIHTDPIYIFHDDGIGVNGNFVNDLEGGSIRYADSFVSVTVDREDEFAVTRYNWEQIGTEDLGGGDVRITERRVFDRIEYLPAASLFPIDGSILCQYYTEDGTDLADYAINLTPTYTVKEQVLLEIQPGSLKVVDGAQATGLYLIDGGDGRLYKTTSLITAEMLHVGNINYAAKTFTIVSDSITLQSMKVLSCSGTNGSSAVSAMVFRTPGAPVKAGQLTMKAVTSAGRELLASTTEAGVIGAETGVGIYGQLDNESGVGRVVFGEWVDGLDPDNQNAEWFVGAPYDATNNLVWKPYMINASDVTINCVIESYLPLDKDLIGLNPIKLPISGRVPIFRDGNVILVQHPLWYDLPDPLDNVNPVDEDLAFSVGRTDVQVLELYSFPTAKQLEDGTQISPVLIPEIDSQSASENYVFDLSLGEVTIKTGFTYPTDAEGTRNPLKILHVQEEMKLVASSQITGHLAITTPFEYDYPVPGTSVSSVLPIGNMFSRMYNEFEMTSWPGYFSDSRPSGINDPLASFNFVDYPLRTLNKSAVKERWAIIFQSSTNVQVVGENVGILVENLQVVGLAADGSGLNTWTGSSILSGTYQMDIGQGNQPYLIIANRNFPGYYYWIMNCNGFGVGWSSGNVIRFNQDAGSFPIYVIRATMQGRQQEPTDYFTLRGRGNSS
jgi:hypothetical protein